MSEYTSEDSEEMIGGIHDDFDARSVHNEIVDTGRWHIHKFAVYKRKIDGTFWGVSWAEAATEMQEDGDTYPPFQVERHEVTAIKWEAKK